MFARLKAKTKDSAFTVRCESIAWRNFQGYGSTPALLTLSVVGTDTAIKAIRAMLWEPPCSVDFYLSRPDEDGDGWTTTRFEKHRNGGRSFLGYECRTARLDNHCVHLVAKAKLDGLLADVSDTALWAELNSDRYTTPLIRPWVPAIRARLLKEELLVEGSGHNTNAGVLLADSDSLDVVVSEGVRGGAMTMKGE